MRPGLYLHAVRSVRARQLRGRLRRSFTRRRFPAGPAPSFAPPSNPVSLWRSPAFEPIELAGEGRERLRGFHAHYGEDALGLARGGDARAVRDAMETWVDANPPRAGDAWHPYTVSTRIGNWIAALALEPDAASSVTEESLWRQLRHLMLNVEDDVLGNHVIRNARALLLGGLAFHSEPAVEQGLALLERELPEQILSDGGHYERSPAYHAVVLRDLEEVHAALPESVPAATLAGMRGFAAGLSRPDGAPAHFNDGGLDVAPPLELPVSPEGLGCFPETGYVVVRRGELWLALDCGPPSPSFLPAHAHADALSFQLWWDGVPVVVDPGTYTYEAGAARDWYRSSEAHSTVALEGRSQFELWGGFRSGPLPRVELREASDSVLAAGVEWPDGATHERVITLDGRTVTVADRIEGKGEREIVSSLPLAPGATVDAQAVGPLACGREERTVSERFFVREFATALVQRGRLDLPAEIGWRLSLS